MMNAATSCVTAGLLAARALSHRNKTNATSSPGPRSAVPNRNKTNATPSPGSAGTVRDVRGRAIAGAVIHVGVDARSPPMSTTHTGPDGAFVAWACPATSTAPDAGKPGYLARGSWHDPPVLTALDGNFRLTGLPRGRFTLRAYREGGPDAVVEHISLGDRAHLTIRPTGILAGIVAPSSAATSIDDITIAAIDRARDVSREERIYHTGGRFALRDLPAGTYHLTVDGDPRSAVTVTLAEGERRADLRLVAQPRFTIRGRLVAADRTPLAGWRSRRLAWSATRPRTAGPSWSRPPRSPSRRPTGTSSSTTCRRARRRSPPAAARAIPTHRSRCSASSRSRAPGRAPRRRPDAR